MNTHGTPLSTGMRANFAAAMAKATALLVDRIDPFVVETWGKDHDALLQHELLRALDLPPAIFHTWRVLDVTIRKQAEHFIELFRQNNVTYRKYDATGQTRNIYVPKCVTSGRVGAFKLACVSMAELGFSSNMTNTLRQAIERAAELELKLVPTELAYELRLEYLDQPEGELLVPVCINDRCKEYKGEVYFLLSSNGRKLTLLVETFSIDRHMRITDRLVFVKSR